MQDDLKAGDWVKATEVMFEPKGNATRDQMYDAEAPMLIGSPDDAPKNPGRTNWKKRDVRGQVTAIVDGIVVIRINETTTAHAMLENCILTHYMG